MTTRRLNVYMGEAIHTLGPGRVMHFKPTGKLVSHDDSKEVREAIKRTSYGKGGLSARIFVGLSVGKKATYTVKDVVKVVKRVRKAQKANPNASILTQTGIYKDPASRVIDEKSVQIVIVDLDGLSEDDFTEQMLKLAEVFVEEFRQKEVLVEVQKRGLVLDVVGVKNVEDEDEEDAEEEEEEDEDPDE